VIEAVQIEGHTDSSGDAISNLRLSTDRANSTFIAMTEQQQGLIDHLNFRGQPVLSVAGYGEMRPVKPNDSPANLATNRRIDLRIIMYTPSRADELEKIRARLTDGLPGASR
jgi:flagellar motor protein MotB